MKRAPRFAGASPTTKRIRRTRLPSGQLGAGVAVVAALAFVASPARADGKEPPPVAAPSQPGAAPSVPVILRPGQRGPEETNRPSSSPTPSSPAPAQRSDDDVDYFTKRYEPAGFPLIGGSSDIGFEFGAVGTLSYFSSGVRPYAWNLDLLASASIKSGPGGVELAQQSYLAQIDWPGWFGGGVRLNPAAFYSRTINEGYFGLGNASPDEHAPRSAPDPGRYHEFVENLFEVRVVSRVAITGPFAGMFAGTYRYVVPESYAGSKLAEDEATTRADGRPLIYGTRPLSMLSAAAGFVYDSRDNEIFSRRGMFHQFALRYEQGIPLGDDVHYAKASAVLAGYVPLGGPFVFAARGVADFQFGHVPFYDLFQAGPFRLIEMPGGGEGVRGVPVGRYLGPIKLVANVELRAMLINVQVLGQKFKIGGDVLFDTGRVFSDYSFRSPLDGRGIGLKYGVGAGAYLLWGQAAIFRVEAAYSPDAVAENHAFPVGLYVEDGTMF